MAANESSGLSFYSCEPESAGPNPRFCAWSRFVSTRCGCIAAAWHAASFGIPGRLQPQAFARLSHATRGRAITAYFEMVSSAMPLVRGPINPIAAITITIAPAMNANTPNVPNPFSTAAITNDEKIAEKRLHE